MVGFYGCNKASMERTTIKGERVILATVVIDDLSPFPRVVTHTVPNWDKNAVKVATEWVVDHMAQLSM